MRFDKLDLNLLIVLNTLLRDRSVSMAAERVGLSQSATSSALGRLRSYFNDELLVMRGRVMVPTPRAEELVDPVAAVLAQIRDTIATPRAFDAALSDRRLTVMTSDYVMEVLLAPALRGIADEAPGMSFQLVPVVEQPFEQLGRGAADLVITTDAAISTEQPHVPLFADDFVVVGWSRNPALAAPLTLESYGALGHVAVRFGRSQVPTFEEWVHRQRAIRRRVEVVAPNFSTVAALVAGTRRIATMHRRLATRLADHHDLVVMEPPFTIPPVRIVAQWLSSAARDPALMWLVDRLKAQSAREFGAAAGGT